MRETSARLALKAAVRQLPGEVQVPVAVRWTGRRDQQLLQAVLQYKVRGGRQYPRAQAACLLKKEQDLGCHTCPTSESQSAHAHAPSHLQDGCGLTTLCWHKPM